MNATRVNAARWPWPKHQTAAGRSHLLILDTPLAIAMPWAEGSGREKAMEAAVEAVQRYASLIVENVAAPHQVDWGRWINAAAPTVVEHHLHRGFATQPSHDIVPLDFETMTGRQVADALNSGGWAAWHQVADAWLRTDCPPSVLDGLMDSRVVDARSYVARHAHDTGSADRAGTLTDHAVSTHADEIREGLSHADQTPREWCIQRPGVVAITTQRSAIREAVVRLRAEKAVSRILGLEVLLVDEGARQVWDKHSLQGDGTWVPWPA